ncbi:MAG: hypothetical protein OXU68_01375 [Bacteroidota bacterium]|nr:hypothetical protein [Bacteroidota bacterium]
MRALWVLAVLCLGACESGVVAVIGTERAYTVYGYLSPRADTQAVRVFAIDGTIDEIRPDPLDARVESVSLDTGQRHAWRDSVIQFAENNFGHVFWTRFTPAYGEQLRLSLTRPDGLAATVDIAMPPLAEPLLEAPTVSPGYVELPVLWHLAPRLNNVRVRYYTNKGRFDFDYGNVQRASPDGPIAAVLPHQDARTIFSEVFRTGGDTREVRLRRIEQFVLVSSANWAPPGNVFDPDLLIEPGHFSNVTNGFGFVGAGYEASFLYEVPDSIALAAGFFVD